MRRWSASVCGIVLLWLAGVAGAAPSDDVPFTVQADSIEYDSARSVYVARGNVRIREGDEQLTADWVMFSTETRQGLASGNVVHVDGPDRMTGDFLQFDIDSFRGFARQGVLTSEESQYVMGAREIRKTGEQTYTFEEGDFTTCDCPDGGEVPWKLEAEHAELDFDGFATARNTTFEMFGVPVLWLPWAAYPLKRERQSGFLLPEFNSTNRSGFDVGLPFYWAVSHDLNLTLTPQYLQKRGVKGKAEAEWHTSYGAVGELFFTMLSDQDVDPDDPQEPFDELRWAVDSKQTWDLPLGYEGRVDANLMSDNRFTRDFRDMREYIYDRYLESTGFVSRSHFAGGWLHSLAGARYADDLQSPDDLDRDDALVQRLPELSLKMLSKPLLTMGPVRVVASMDADYTYYWSEERASDTYPGLVVGDDVFVDTGIDGVPSAQEQNAAGRVVAADQHRDDFATSGGTEGDGVFQEGELLGDRGHRVWLHPRLSLPFSVGGVEVVPEVGYHQTLYQTAAQSFEERGMITGRLDVRTRLRRAWEGGWLERPITHVLEPFFSWGLVEQTGQRDNPLFIPDTALPQERIRLLDLDNVIRDRADRVERFHGFTVGFRNTFLGRALSSSVDPETGEITYTSDQSRLLADVTVGFGYEIAGSSLGNFVVDGRWWPWTGWTSDFHVNYDVGDNDFDEGLLRLGYWSEHGHNLSVQYRFINEIPDFFEAFRSDQDRLDDFEEGFDQVNQLSLNTRWAMTRQWALTYNVGYTFEEAFFLSHRGGVEYTSNCRCWAIQVTADFRRQTGFDIGVRYTLLGLGGDPARPFGR